MFSSRLKPSRFKEDHVELKPGNWRKFRNAANNAQSLAKRASLNALALVLALVSGGLVHAQAYPNKPVRVVIPWPLAGMPKPIIDKLNADINKALKLPDVVQTLSSQGLDPWLSTVEEFGARLKADYDKYAQLIKLTGARID